jgi:hypothetical protein
VIRPLPGIEAHTAELQAHLAHALARRPGRVPRTRHVANDRTPLYTNRLALENSPYLLQHAHNPVNWYAWGDQAFDEARRLGRPVFLSIGYSTCHWCHVMEEESFEDETIAGFLNAHYVAIKVDREERPDVDAVYMRAAHQLGGSGGWPLSVWLNAEREPFFVGTYFPPYAGRRGAGPGFLEILTELERLWSGDAKRVHEAAQALATAVREIWKGRAAGMAWQERTCVSMFPSSPPLSMRALVPLMTKTAGCGRHTSSPRTFPFDCFCAITNAPAMPTRCTWPRARWKPWRQAESTTT